MGGGCGKCTSLSSFCFHNPLWACECGRYRDIGKCLPYKDTKDKRPYTYDLPQKTKKAKPAAPTARGRGEGRGGGANKQGKQKAGALLSPDLWVRYRSLEELEKLPLFP
jgi:hypothetical protein